MFQGMEPMYVAIIIFLLIVVAGLTAALLIINKKKDKIIDKAMKLFTLLELKLDTLDEIRDDIKEIGRKKNSG